MESAPITLPATLPPPRRAPLPLLAAFLPIGAGVAMWLITGAVYALWFSLLGPLMLGASVADTARGRRVERRREQERADVAWREAEAELESRHRSERESLDRVHPDVASCVQVQPLRDAQPPERDTPLVIGRGRRPSALRCNGGDDARAREFRERCAVLEDAPVVVPLGGGVCLRGPEPIVNAAARALILQLCLRFSAVQLRLTGEGLERAGLTELPHARRLNHGGFRVGLGAVGAERVEADATIWMAATGDEPPEGVKAVIDLVEPWAATVRTAEGATVFTAECLSRAQAAGIAEACVDREGAVATVPTAVSLVELSQPEPGDGLPTAIGRGEQGEVVVDIVADGPHAIVTGVTGSGKSELLVTWVTAIAERYGPEQVSFVLADFKGGTAFEPLRGLRQVSAVITDLDEESARRGVASLSAELRRREAVLAAAGARDVGDLPMPRLVIVVDEFATLLLEHPDLAAVFTDVAARGRALGMHLVLGTQRAAGVVRDALAANCPLRISLRLADASDSRSVIGTDAAAQLPGGADGRGLALVRRPVDREPVALRVAMTTAADLRRVALRWDGHASPESPWLPSLPRRLDLDDLRGASDPDAAAPRRAGIILGRADDPEHQAQPLEMLQPGTDRGLVVLGAPGTGRTAVLRTIAAQWPAACWVPRDPEAATDLVGMWASAAEHPPQLVLCDDLDAIHAELPTDYAHEFALRWEQTMRNSPGVTWVLTAARATGPLGRVFDALPRRALLQMPSRVEHLAAGGEADGFRRDRAPGRARIDGREVQFAWTEEDRYAPFVSSVPAWQPSAPVTALVTQGAASVASAVRANHPEWDVIDAGDDPERSNSPCVMVGEADAWQRNWSLWQQVRARGEVLIRVERPADLRQLLGVRDLPPYARPHAGRLWSIVGDGEPRRVMMPALSRRSSRGRAYER